MDSYEKRLLLIIRYMPIFAISIIYFMFFMFLFIYNYELFNACFKQFILFSIIFILISLYFSFKISNYLQKLLLDYRNEILKNTEKNKIKDLMLFQQSKLATISELLYNISHQWRQPLSVIITIASGIKIKKELGINDDSKDIEMFEGILKSANYLSQTIEGFRDFRDFYTSNTPRINFSISKCINKCIKIIDQQFLNKNIIIKRDIEEFDIYGFEQQLIRVLLNILNNARDALEKNDLTLRIIFIKTKLLKDCITISINDNGGGIEEKNFDKIFEPYFTTKHQSKGKGVSLYMSYQMISKSFGGEIFVKDSEIEYLDKTYIGANFKITIPLDNLN
jgi:signal transduction histidine kinase